MPDLARESFDAEKLNPFASRRRISYGATMYVYTGALYRMRAVLLAVVAILLNSNNGVSAQRFMRQGFSNQEDFGAEMKLEESEGAVDMTREMFLMQDLKWQLQPVANNYSAVTDRAVRKHLQKHLGKTPVELKLLKKRGKFGLRAVGRTEKNGGKKLRAFWRQSAGARGGVNFLEASFDEACRSRLFTVEFEVQLPPVPRNKSANNQNAVLPSVVYQVSVEPGSMNAKALVPRSASRVFVYPAGRGGAAERVEVGKANVSVVPMKAGLVDPGWAKGRPIFRKGRNSGLCK